MTSESLTDSGPGPGQHLPANAVLPVDLSGLTKENLDATMAGFQWPTAFPDYRFISYDLVDAISDTFGMEETDSREAGALHAKLIDILLDYAKLARIGLDAHNLQQAGATPLYDARQSPVFHHIATGLGNPADVVAHWKRPLRGGGANRARRQLRLARRHLSCTFLPPTRRVDMFNQNILMSEFQAAHAEKYVDLLPAQFDWGGSSRLPPLLSERAAASLDILQRLMEPRIAADRTILERIANMARHAVSFHLEEAWHHISLLEASPVWRRPARRLLTGTPKYRGRLISWHYKRAGSQVSRFTHGGDRGLFDDYFWSWVELPYADQYFGHGRGEAENIAARYRDGRLRRLPGRETAPRFLTEGSRKHAGIAAAARAPRQSQTNRIIYVPGGYIDERLINFPAFHIPDIMFLDWQRWMLTTLRAQGFHVATKVHPKGLYASLAPLERYSDEIIGGHLDPNEHAPACYLFDFAGTAFFDVLATQTGVVYCDFGYRPIDPNSKTDLAARCEILPIQHDDGNRFRCTPEALITAVEAAREYRPESDRFFRRYFCT